MHFIGKIFYTGAQSNLRVISLVCSVYECCLRKRRKKEMQQYTAELTYTFAQNRSRYVTVNYFSERRALSFILLEACRRAHEVV
jgi:hypothetical protein